LFGLTCLWGLALGLYKAVTDCLKIGELTQNDLAGAQLVLSEWLLMREGGAPPPPDLTQAERVLQMRRDAAAQKAAPTGGQPPPSRPPPPPPSPLPPSRLPPPPSPPPSTGTDSSAAADPYAVMGVPIDATSGAIRKAFRALSLQYHPDKNVGDETAASHFVEIAAAYEIIGNPDRRAAFDDFGVRGDMAAEADGAGFDSYHEYLLFTVRRSTCAQFCEAFCFGTLFAHSGWRAGTKPLVKKPRKTSTVAKHSSQISTARCGKSAECPPGARPVTTYITYGTHL
jgi:hypothetical protein